MSVLARQLMAEFIGSALLVMAVVGSGVMACRPSPDDVGLQLLQNSLATGAALVALITGYFLIRFLYPSFTPASAAPVADRKVFS